MAIYNIHGQVKLLQHMSAGECAISFWWKWLSAPEMLKCVENMGAQSVVRAHPNSNTIVTNVSQLSFD